MRWELFFMMPHEMHEPQIHRLSLISESVALIFRKMIKQTSIAPTQLRSLIRSRKLTLAGNQRLKIYGKLNCSSGKRMKKENRVFFNKKIEAVLAGYRPCGHCLNEKYLVWK